MNLKPRSYETYLFFFLIALLALGQLQRITLNPGIHVYLHDILISSWLIAMVWENRTNLLPSFNFKKNFKKYWLEISFLGWISFSWLISFLAGDLELITLAYISRITVYLTWAWLFYQKNKRLKKERRIRQIFAVSFGWFVALFGLLQYIFIPDTKFLKVLGWDDHYFRLISTQFDPNFSGIILVICYWLTFQLIDFRWKKEFKNLPKTLGWIQIGLLLAIALTFSRASFLALGLGILYQLWGGLIKNTQKILVHLLILVALIVVIPKPAGEGVNLTRTSTIQARVKVGETTVHGLQAYQLITGRGLFAPIKNITSNINFLRSNNAKQTDNILLFLFNGSGLIGLGLGGAMLLKWAGILDRKNSYLTASYLGILSHSLFNNTLLQSFVLLYLLISVGIFYDKN